MDSPGEESEAFDLRNQLKVYQQINGDLSKKIQELKIELNQNQRELLHSQNQLLSTREALIKEKGKLQVLKQYCAKTNDMCLNFFKHFHSNLEQLDSSELDISFNIGTNDDSVAQAAATAVKPAARGFVDLLLGTIQEESLNLATSTPFQGNNLKRSLPNLRAFEQFNSLNDSSISQPDNEIVEMEKQSTAQESTVEDQSMSTLKETPKTTLNGRETCCSPEEMEVSTNRMRMYETRNANSLLAEMKNSQVNVTLIQAPQESAENSNSGEDSSPAAKRVKAKRIVESSSEESMTTEKAKRPLLAPQKSPVESTSSEDEGSPFPTPKPKRAAKKKETVVKKSKKAPVKSSKKSPTDLASTSKAQSEDDEPVAKKSKRIAAVDKENKKGVKKSPAKKSNRKEIKEIVENKQESEDDEDTGKRQRKRPNYAEKKLNTKMRRDR